MDQCIDDILGINLRRNASGKQQDTWRDALFSQYLLVSPQNNAHEFREVGVYAAITMDMINYTNKLPEGDHPIVLHRLDYTRHERLIYNRSFFVRGLCCLCLLPCEIAAIKEKVHVSFVFNGTLLMVTIH